MANEEPITCECGAVLWRPEGLPDAPLLVEHVAGEADRVRCPRCNAVLFKKLPRPQQDWLRKTGTLAGEGVGKALNPMPEYIYITLVASAAAYDELKAKLVGSDQQARIFTHEGVEHLDYNEIPLKAESNGGDVSTGTWNQLKGKFNDAGLFDRIYREGDDPEGPELLDMSGTALRRET